MANEAHAVLSPSSAVRWMTCPGSVVLEADEPNEDNEYSKEGTLAHALAAHCLLHKVDAHQVPFFTHNGKDETITQEMAGFVQEYIDYVWGHAAGQHLLVEQRLELEWLTGEKDAYGTADKVVLFLGDDTDILDLDDFKYGFREVEVHKNPQLLIYALAALRQFEMMGNFKKVRVGIHQPRIENVDKETVMVSDLKKFEKDVRAAVKQVGAAKKSNSLDGFLHPSEKACQWCKAKGKCPALAGVVVEITGADFNDVSQTELIAPVDLGVAMSKIDLIEAWAKGVRGKVEAELLSGRPVTGYKLVEGKKGNRQWIDEDDAEKKMRALKLRDEEIFSLNILTPSKLEKKLKAKPDIWNKLTNLITQKKGQPSVAPISDPRSAYNPKPEEDFEDVNVTA